MRKGRKNINGWTLYIPSNKRENEKLKPEILKKEDKIPVKMFIGDEEYDSLVTLSNIYSEDDRNTLPVVYYKIQNEEDDELT
jgi:hypothetical protein